MVEILMIFGINQAEDPPIFNPLCYTMGLFLHWTLLTTFTWSLLAGFQIYLMLVVVFDTETRMKKYRQVAYGFPTLILITAVIIDQLLMEGVTYTSNYQCWMRAGLLFIWSFLVPVS